MTQPSPLTAALTCRCPRCGEGKLFQGFLTLRPHCDKCGLDYGTFDSGDGPAVFIILARGLHRGVRGACSSRCCISRRSGCMRLLWLPLILIVTLLPLRPMKALMIALQHRHKAAEGRLEMREPTP